MCDVTHLIATNQVSNRDRTSSVFAAAIYRENSVKSSRKWSFHTRCIYGQRSRLIHLDGFHIIIPRKTVQPFVILTFDVLTRPSPTQRTVSDYRTAETAQTVTGIESSLFHDSTMLFLESVTPPWRRVP